MKKKAGVRGAILLTTVALLFVAFAVIAYAHEASVRSADQCDELLASYKRLDAKARGAGSDFEELERIWKEVKKVITKMRSLRCANTPDVPLSGSQSGEAMRGIQGPGGEGVAEYKVLPDARYMSFGAFIEKAQPPDSEAEGSCGDLSGRWRITTSEGSQTWEIWKTDTPRVYGGRDRSGNSNNHAGMLAALLEGSVLRFQFDVTTEQDEIFGGTYNCKLDANCRSSLSPCKMTYDLNRRGSFDATFKWLGPLQRRQ